MQRRVLIHVIFILVKFTTKKIHARRTHSHARTHTHTYTHTLNTTWIATFILHTSHQAHLNKTDNSQLNTTVAMLTSVSTLPIPAHSVHTPTCTIVGACRIAGAALASSLLRAARYNEITTASRLLEYGQGASALTAVNERGDTALMLAAEMGHTEMCALLHA